MLGAFPVRAARTLASSSVGEFPVYLEIVRRFRNLMFDLRHGSVLAGNRATRHLEAGAHDVVNTDVTALERIFEGRVRDDDVLVDVGCGKGRVLRWWAARTGAERIVGLELDEEIAAETRRRLRRESRVTVLAGDAVANLPADGTLFYLHNPFGAPVVGAFRDAVAGRPGIRILYYNPVHAEEFGAGWRVERVALGEGFHDLCVIEPSA
jgi:SAM-dependent methyltransferase